ncbi:carboxypeptidase [Burkholderia pseudomallei]|nr:carboxypeptidase [Burkholderia pseudomallei]QBP59210.1 carboxypeptidase [Burkholderia pseudomallei]
MLPCASCRATGLRRRRDDYVCQTWVIREIAMRIVSALGRRPLSLHAARERPRPCIEGPAPRGASMLARVAPFCPTTAGPGPLRTRSGSEASAQRSPRLHARLACLRASRARGHDAHRGVTRLPLSARSRCPRAAHAGVTACAAALASGDFPVARRLANAAAPGSRVRAMHVERLMIDEPPHVETVTNY